VTLGNGSDEPLTLCCVQSIVIVFDIFILTIIAKIDIITVVYDRRQTGWSVIS